MRPKALALLLGRVSPVIGLLPMAARTARIAARTARIATRTPRIDRAGSRLAGNTGLTTRRRVR